MNQILSTDISGNKKKNKNSKPIEINNIVKFFAIAIIIFGIFNILISYYYKGIHLYYSIDGL